MGVSLPEYCPESSFKDDMGEVVLDIVDTAAPIQTTTRVTGTPDKGRIYITPTTLAKLHTIAVVRYHIIHEGEALPQDFEEEEVEQDPEGEFATRDMIDLEIYGPLAAHLSPMDITIPFEADMRPLIGELRAYFAACEKACEPEEEQTGFLGAGQATAT